MAYDDIRTCCVALPEFDFGGGAAEILSFRLPTGFKARLVKIGVAVTETFACDSTVAHVQLGTAADADAYAKLQIPDATADVDFFDETDDTDAILAANIAADTLLQVTLTNGTDGSGVAGKGYTVLWFELYKG